MSRQQGFTLIELMITIALLAFIVLIAAPLGGGWVRSADLIEVEGDMTQAFGRARAQALRNLPGAVGADPATAVCLSDTHQLTVLQGTDTDLPSCGTNTGTVLWQTQLDTDVTVEFAGNDFSCACYNNQGYLTTQECAGCATEPKFKLVVGGGVDDETITLY